MKPLISVIMPTLNEEKNISWALKSIRMQTVNQKLVEILVIDGGSTDRTREIAESYGARIIDNPKVLPEEAKGIGLKECTGKYIVFLDADNELADKNQLKKRVDLFNCNDKVKTIIRNSLLTPSGYPSLTRYTNIYGDPFSYFIHRFDGEDFISSLDRKRYKFEEYKGNSRIYYIQEGDLTPIGDGNSLMLDFEYLKTHFSNRLSDPMFISTMFEEVVKNTGCFGIVENDAINHYTTISLRTFLKKLKFRVIMNLSSEESDFGYSARANMNKKLFGRKYLFVLYCLLPPVVLIDSAFMAVRKKSVIFMLHFLFVYYVIFTIAYCKVLRLLGVKVRSGTYGK